MLDILKAKPGDTHFHLAETKIKYDFLQCWHSSECWSSCYVQCSPQTLLKLPASLRYKFVILFSAYRRESWSTNTRRDDLHLIWYHLHSVAGAMFHSRFLVLQTVSSQSNQKVICCCCYYLR